MTNDELADEFGIGGFDALVEDLMNDTEVSTFAQWGETCSTS